MYTNESKYVFDEDTAIENVDYWFAEREYFQRSFA
jgi:hypothetical protein